MVVSKSGMGMKKHGRSGVAPKSPKLRHTLLREANQDRPAKPKTEMFSSVQDLMNKKP